MMPRFEKIELKRGRSFLAKEICVPRFPAPWHFHPEIELSAVLESGGRRFVGNSIEPFRAGDLVLIGPNVPHFWHNEGRRARRSHSRAVVVQFLPEFVGPDFFSRPELAPIQKLLRESARGLVFTGAAAADVVRRMRALTQKTGLDALLGLFAILGRLAGARRRPLTSAAYVPSLDHEVEARLGRVYAFLMAQFREPLSLPEIAARAAMTPAAFSRFFKRVSGRNVSDFLNDLRIDDAIRRLQETDEGIARIAYESGFSTLSSFNRRFRERMGCSPRSYRNTFAASVKEAGGASSEVYVA